MFVVYFGSTHCSDPFSLLLRNSQLYPNAERRTVVCTRKLVVCERHAAPVELSRRQSRPGGRLPISTVPAQLATCRVNKLNSLSTPRNSTGRKNVTSQRFVWSASSRLSSSVAAGVGEWCEEEKSTSHAHRRAYIHIVQSSSHVSAANVCTQLKFNDLRCYIIHSLYCIHYQLICFKYRVILFYRINLCINYKL